MFRTMQIISAVGLAAGITAVAATLMAKDGVQVVQVRDDCDPFTFDAAVGPGTCVGDGETTFPDFIADVSAQQSVDKWRFNPSRLDEPQPLVARNRGGETHTFTKVDQFGGSIVPPLNALLGNHAPAQACATATFVPPGGTFSVPSAAKGDKFQCCIHPWMQLTVR